VRDVAATGWELAFCDCCDEPWCERHDAHYSDCACIGPVEIEELSIDLVYGGFPCTDISAAKDRWGATGLMGEQSGLWAEFERIIAITGPRWVVIENTGRLRNGRNGADLAAIVAALDGLSYLGIGAILDAAAFGLPARRPRTYLVARRGGDSSSVSDFEGLADGFIRYDPGCVVLEGAGQPLAADFRCKRPDPSSYRKLTPRECERLMGFPDDWTRWNDEGNEIADSHRYRMMGNAVAVPVVEWIARRLVALDNVDNAANDRIREAIKEQA
jgi:DNA (cytosine-5)-methyltransferase 1